MTAKQATGHKRSHGTDYPGPCRVFYLDVPLVETMRRHAARPPGQKVGADEFSSWHLPHDEIGVPEKVVLQTSNDSLEETFHRLLTLVSDVVPPRG